MRKCVMERKILRMDTEALADAINKAVGAEMRGMRAKRGMSREALASAAGLGLSTLQRFEKGQRSPDLHQLALITRALSVPMNEFVAAALKGIDGIE